MVSPMSVVHHPVGKRRNDTSLWWVAFGLSVIGNLVIILLWALLTRYQAIRFANSPRLPTEAPQEKTVQIFPVLEKPAAVPTVVNRRAQSVRTSEDQRSRRPSGPAFIGERDTQATSDRPADPTAPELPQQAGIEPKDELDFETTQSEYQDGELTDAAASSANASPSTAQPPNADKAPPTQAAKETPPSAANAERLFDGPTPVEVAKREPSETNEVAPAEASPPADSSPPEPPAKDEKTFAGFQRKTAIRGSISRTGRSALDVADTPLGRYQSLISRAVELEWQRNCVRHRDFITPGFLTARFFVQPSGKVSHVEFIGEMETGQVQKGFTLNSIRNANIPAMPTNLKKEFDDEALELIFNFYF